MVGVLNTEVSDQAIQVIQSVGLRNQAFWKFVNSFIDSYMNRGCGIRGVDLS